MKAAKIINAKFEVTHPQSSVHCGVVKSRFESEIKHFALRKCLNFYKVLQYLIYENDEKNLKICI